MALVDLLFVFTALYILYKLVFNFIVPVFKVASSMRTQMRNMDESGMRQSSPAQKSNYTTAAKTDNNNTANKDSEYIDFEEIK